MEKSADDSKAKRDNLMAGIKMMSTQQKAAQELVDAKTEEERKEKEATMEQAQVDGMINVTWTTTVVDITTTLHEAAQMALHDQSVDKDTMKRRGFGLKHLGEIFMACKAPTESGQPEDAKKLYKEATFTAMLETIQRKEESVNRVSVKY